MSSSFTWKVSQHSDGGGTEPLQGMIEIVEKPANCVVLLTCCKAIVDHTEKEVFTLPLAMSSGSVIQAIREQLDMQLQELTNVQRLQTLC